MNTIPDPEESLTLEILDTVQRNEQLSQRHLSRQLGVALGLANSYLKRCVRKGWVKVQQAPANRYLYYLTPMGFAEKSRLTAEYLSNSLSFYRQAGLSCSQLLDQCERNHWKKLLLCGVSDLAEIATLRAMERDFSIIGIFCLKLYALMVSFALSSIHNAIGSFFMISPVTLKPSDVNRI